MLENAIYSILSPEGYSSILWKDSSRYKEAAEKMKVEIIKVLQEQGEKFKSESSTLLDEVTKAMDESRKNMEEIKQTSDAMIREHQERELEVRRQMSKLFDEILLKLACTLFRCACAITGEGEALHHQLAVLAVEHRI